MPNYTAEKRALLDELGGLQDTMKRMVSTASERGKSDPDKRSFTTEEDEKWNKLNTRADTIEAEVKRLDALQERERFLSEPADEPILNNPEDRSGVDPDSAEQRKLEMAATRRFLRGDNPGSFSADELRALQADSDTLGGFLTMPRAMSTELLKNVDNVTYFRQLATIEPMAQSGKWGIPTLETDIGDLTWTAEIATGSEDSSMAFGGRQMDAHPLARRIKVSKTLLRQAALPVEQIVISRLRYKFSTVMENAYLNGDGQGKPLGVFTASNNGIPATTYDEAGNNTTDTIKDESLINAIEDLKAPYKANATWWWSRAAMKQIRKIKLGTGEYAWSPGLQADRPNLILGRPYVVSEYVPTTFTTGKYVGIVGDFRAGYKIMDSLQFEIQRLMELYAETNQIGFIARYEGDGAPMLAEAFRRITLG